jgi:hypothetical protein
MFGGIARITEATQFSTFLQPTNANAWSGLDIFGARAKMTEATACENSLQQMFISHSHTSMSGVGAIV